MAPDLTLGQIPASDCDFEEILEFAATYDGYRRIAESPETLSAVYQPIRMEWRRSGALPDRITDEDRLQVVQAVLETRTER
jgi:hypothetical protein